MIDTGVAHPPPPAPGPAPAGLRICLLNRPRLVLQSGAEHALERKDAALLAVLALDGPTPRAKVSALLWPDAAEGQARSNLRQRLFRLRRTARQDVVLDGDGLQLAAHLQLDLADPPPQGSVETAPGELLGAHDYAECEALERWVGAARQRWRSACNERLAGLASGYEAAGQIALALPLAQRFVECEPLLEHGHRRVMRLHYLRGDRAAALAAFEHCRQVLRAQLGAKPSAETQQLAALVDSAGAPARGVAAPRPVAALRPPRLVGRDTEARVLRTAPIALLIGEPGIGKTRLLGEVAAAAPHALVLGARPGDAALPYALLARLARALAQRFGVPATEWVRHELARIVPELGTAPSAVLAPVRLQQALGRALADARCAGLSLVALDDLHFADNATLELLLPLIGVQHGSAPLAWLMAAREHALPPRLVAWLGAGNATAVCRVALGPLGPREVEALLASLALPGLDAAAWAAPLHRHTGGNPMFILETLIAMLDADPGATRAQPPALPAPQRVGALIEQRLAQLSPPALRLARVAALSGGDFDAELAAAVLGQHLLDVADAWRELESAQILHDHAFAHDLIFEATLRSVPAPIARALHQQIAVQLQARGAAPTRVAAHLEAAGEAAGASCRVRG